MCELSKIKTFQQLSVLNRFYCYCTPIFVFLDFPQFALFLISMDCKLRKLFFILIAFALFAGCAKRSSPPGGPKDESSPDVLQFIPGENAVEVPLDRTIILHFNEPIKTDPDAVVFHPLVEGMTKVFTRKSIEIRHTGKFAENKTYTLTLTPKFSDRHGNSLEKTHIFAFSTGEYIDSSKISGIVLDGSTLKPAEKVLIAAYGDSMRSDNPIRVGFSGTDGKFSMEYLPDDTIWLFAAAGIGSKFDWEQAEKIALPISAVKLPTSDKATLVIETMDTIPPKITSITRPDNYTARIKFTEQVAIDSLDIHKDSHDVKFWYSPTDSTSILWRSLQPLVRDSLTIRACDFFGNCVELTGEIPSEAPEDTLPPSVILLGKKSLQMMPSRNLKLFFSEPFSAQFSCFLDDSILPFDILRITHNAIELLFEKPLIMGETLTIIIDSLCDDFANCITDTESIAILLKKPGSVELESNWQCEYPIFFLFNESNSYFLEPDENNKFIVSLPPGDYKLCGICDNNADGRWTPGNIKPFRYSERLETYTKTISVRAGWLTEISW